MVIEASTWTTFLLVFVRITVFMVTAPLFSGRQIPSHFKIGFSFMLSILCFSSIQDPIPALSEWMLILLILKEFMVGIVLGMVASILLNAVQLAGSLMDLQIGFSMASLFDPNFGMTTQLTGRFKNLLAILFLLSSNAHHYLIQGILASFNWVTLQAEIPSWMDGRISTFLLECVTQMFMIGFMMAAPIIGTLFVVDVALGMISRVVPQMNIFAVLPPIKILIHFLIYLFVLPSFFYLLKVLFETMFNSMDSIMKIMGA